MIYIGDVSFNIYEVQQIKIIQANKLIYIKIKRMHKLLSCIRCLTLKRATSLLQLLIVCIVIALCLIVLTVNRVMMDGLISEISDKLLLK